MSTIRNMVMAGLVLALGASVGVQGHAYASSTRASKTLIITEASNKYLYKPKAISVAVGTKVIWNNKSDALHTITGKGSWASYNKKVAAGKTLSYTFKKAGMYSYYCTIHPYMKGTITVH